jgi:hypothetical protein
MLEFCLPNMQRAIATRSASSSFKASNAVWSASALASGAVIGGLSSHESPLPALFCVPSPSADAGRGGSRLDLADLVELKADA